MMRKTKKRAKVRSSRGTVERISLPGGMPIFACAVEPDWRVRNAPRWEAALRSVSVSGVEAVTLAVVRWHGLKEPQFGVALWLDERAGSSDASVKEVVAQVGEAILELPPSEKSVLVVGQELECLFCDVDEPVFVKDAASFAVRRQAVRARGPANVAYDPFVRQ